MKSQLPFTFSVNWKITCLCLLMLPLLLHLGFWQLDRGHEKQQLLEHLNAQQTKPAIELNANVPIDATAMQYRRVKVEGKLDTKRYWLVENKIVNAKVGAYVVVPFHISHEKIMAVNLGWVPLPARRDDAFSVDLPKGILTLSGYLHTPTRSALIDESKNIFTQWPHRVLEIDLIQMQKQINLPLLPLVLNIDPDNIAAKHVNWKPINVSVSKHIGYAVQWFCMALALVILWLAANTNSAQYLKSRFKNT